MNIKKIIFKFSFISTILLLFILPASAISQNLPINNENKDEIFFSSEVEDVSFSIISTQKIEKEVIADVNETTKSLIKVATENKIKETKLKEEKEKQQKAAQANKTNTRIGSPMSATDTELDILAKIIYAEANAEPYEGKVAVGAVVLNRVKSSRYPNNIHDVVFARNQFTPTSDGSYYAAKPRESEYNAAREALSGVDPTNGALTFYAYKYSYSAYHESLTHTATIGGHKFFK